MNGHKRVQPTLVTQHIADKHLGEAPWMAFPGGELEGRPPRVMCRACRDRAHSNATLCFQCYRAGLDRERALKNAAELDTASDARFQTLLPFEPVNRPRLERLRVERSAARNAELQSRQGALQIRIRRAQIAAREVFQRVVSATHGKSAIDASRAIATVTHAAEAQLPEAWLPFVVAR
jgi:hypothetical protein